MEKKKELKTDVHEKQEIYNKIYKALNRDLDDCENGAILSKEVVQKFLQSGTIDLQLMTFHNLKLAINLKQLETLNRFFITINTIFKDYDVEIEDTI